MIHGPDSTTLIGAETSNSPTLRNVVRNETLSQARLETTQTQVVQMLLLAIQVFAYIAKGIHPLTSLIFLDKVEDFIKQWLQENDI